MHFVFYKILARLVAIYLCVDCSRKLWHGLVERRIVHHRSSDIIEFILGWDIDRSKVFCRDKTPVRYWIVICGEAMVLVACSFVAIFGWWQSTT